MSFSLLQIPSILEQYVFLLPNLADRLKCVICHTILKNAKQTSCGCKVCEKCIRTYLSSGDKPCPGKQIDCTSMLNLNKDIIQDNATNKEIGNLKVKCPFSACKFENQLKNLSDHLINCEYREIICDKCSQKYTANEKMKHDQTLCEMRNATCPHCSKTMKHNELKNVHLEPDSDELCIKYIAMCPNKCSINYKVPLREHLANCVNKKLECPFHSLHCEIGKMGKDQLAKHLQDEFVPHISSLIAKITSQDQQLTALQTELNTQKQLSSELFEMNRKSSESRLKMEKTIEDLRKKSPQTAAIPQSVDKSIIFRNGSFIWKFTDFESKRIDADSGLRISLTSEAFYTSDFGYKMCLRIYPAGDGVGKGTHLSVFFAIMRGDYDDLLAWPFKQKVTLSILDQEGGTKHHSDTFKPDSRSACYQKPTDECNIASGSPRFILLSLLTNTDSIFCQHDTLYLKISVDTIGISRP